MSANEIALSALWAQWVGSIAALLGVGAAIIFGIVTLKTSNRSKDTQQRATLTAAVDPMDEDIRVAVAQMAKVHWAVRPKGGEYWLLVNEGSEQAWDVSIAGLTDIDQKRLISVAKIPNPVRPAGMISFELVSRLTLSGPANVVVSYSLMPDGSGREFRRVLLVPAL
jgi:hypothetical protein